MCLLITTLADNSDLEIHVFGPDGGGGGGSGIEAGEATGGDQVVEALRSAVHYWHQVSRKPFLERNNCFPRDGKRRVTVMYRGGIQSCRRGGGGGGAGAEAGAPASLYRTLRLMSSI